ncbi:MAG: YitT family protein [Halanaerobiaceae bacterium]
MRRIINNSKRFFYDYVLDYLGLTLGIALMALGLSVFLIPGQIVAGGVSGIAIILYYFFQLPVGWVMLIINIPIFIIALKTLGVSLIFRSLYGIILFSFSIEFLEQFDLFITDDLLLSAIYGGLLVGLGLGVVFRLNGTTGGTDMAARVLNYFTELTTGQSLLIIDGAILVLAAGFFGLEKALYGVIVIFIASRTIDIIQEGPNISKMAIIISDKSDTVKKKVIEDIDRGITTLEGKGGFTGKERPVLMCVINRTEVTKLKKLVRETDENAFIIISSVNEVLGEGFISK